MDAKALEERTHPAWRRLKFDELLAQQFAMRIAYRERRGRESGWAARRPRARRWTPRSQQSAATTPGPSARESEQTE